MSTTAEPTAASTTVAAAEMDMVTTLHIGAHGLDRFLDVVEDRRRPLIKYRQGSLTLVSPSQRHERGAERLDGLVKGICAVMNLNDLATASTLFRREGLDQGIEADKTYYIQHEPDIRAVGDEIDLNVSPPPDLAIEVVVTHDPRKSLGIYQELKIPEVWVYRYRSRGNAIQFLCLDVDGRYQEHASSRAFPFLQAVEVPPWIDESRAEPDNVWESRLRAWVRDVLTPRVPPGNLA